MLAMIYVNLSVATIQRPKYSKSFQISHLTPISKSKWWAEQLSRDFLLRLNNPNITIIPVSEQYYEKFFNIYLHPLNYTYSSNFSYGIITSFK